MTKRIFYPLFLLFFPLIGMVVSKEVNWSPFDFIIMGFLLTLFGVGYNFITNHSKNLKNRILLIGTLVLMFLLVWIELSVGVFGTPFSGN